MTENKYFRMTSIAAVLTLVVALFLSTIRVDALSSSSLQLTDSRPSQTSSYTFSTSGLTTGTTINCIQLDIGTAVDGTGDAGLTVAGAALGANTIPSSGSWTVGAVEGTDQLRATLVAGATPNASGSITWSGVTNGPTANNTYFAVFSTYANTDCATGGPVDTTVVTLIYKDGALVSLTIDPTLTFTIAGVSDTAETVNGVSTTITTTPTAVSFLNSVTPSNNGVSAHDLTASTNASGGYALYIRHTGLLTNGSSDTITNWTGDNTTPTNPFPTGSEAWGYTTEDSTLQSGTANRFTNGGDFWAGFSDSTNELVADEVGPGASNTTRVGHQVAVSGTTEAGTYQTTIIYTAASTY